MHQLSTSTAADACCDIASRREVVRRACNKDRHAFEGLYEYYQSRVERYLFNKVHDREASYDLCQDTFLRAWRFLSQQESVSEAFADRFEPWLYSIASNAAIDHIRHSRRFEWLPLFDPDTALGDTRYDARQVAALVIDGREREEILCNLLSVREILAELSPQYRACVMLQAEQGLTQQEIATVLGISEKTVSANVSRAYKQLRRRWLLLHICSSEAEWIRLLTLCLYLDLIITGIGALSSLPFNRGPRDNRLALTAA